MKLCASFGVIAAFAGLIILSPPIGEGRLSVRAAVALCLFGQPDPNRVVAAGLHGLGAQPVPITLTQHAACRFTIGARDRSETIDFARVSAIRYVGMVDAAAGLARMFAPSLQPSAAPRRLSLAIVDGADGAICNAAGCSSQRVFALADDEQPPAARAAALALLSRVCFAKASD